jgi:hypothetical protein
MTGVAGSPYYSNLYFTGVATVEQAQDVVDNTEAFWDGLADSMMNTIVGVVQADVALIDEVSGDITGVLTTTGGSFTGSVAGDMLPPASQGLLRLFTNTFVGGRRIRGRVFLPAQAEANSTLGKPSGAWVTAQQSILNTFIAAGITDGSELVIWSRKNGVAPLVAVGSPWDQWAVLRSRRD